MFPRRYIYSRGGVSNRRISSPPTHPTPPFRLFFAVLGAVGAVGAFKSPRSTPPRVRVYVHVPTLVKPYTQNTHNTQNPPRGVIVRILRILRIRDQILKTRGRTFFTRLSGHAAKLFHCCGAIHQWRRLRARMYSWWCRHSWPCFSRPNTWQRRPLES